MKIDRSILETLNAVATTGMCVDGTIAVLEEVTANYEQSSDFDCGNDLYNNMTYLLECLQGFRSELHERYHDCTDEVHRDLPEDYKVAQVSVL